MTWRRIKFALGCLALLVGEGAGLAGTGRAQEQPANLADSARQSEAAPSAQTADQKGTDQDTQDSQDAVDENPNSLGLTFLKHLVADQKSIWSSPAHLRWADASWLFPLATVTDFAFATDKSLATSLSHDPSRVGRYNNVSNYGLASLVGAGAGIYLWSRISHDEHQRETGVLASEAAIDGFATNEALAYALGRERPYQDQGNGTFFKGGTSFPSDHSSVAWQSPAFSLTSIRGL